MARLPRITRRRKAPGCTKAGREAITANPGDLFLEWEQFLASTFGKRRAHGLAGVLDTEWSEEWLARLLRAVRQHVAYSACNTDRLHREALLGLCDRAKADLGMYRGVNNRAAFGVLMLCRIVFELLGEQPGHWRERVVNRPEQWRLNSTRTLNYSQNAQLAFPDFP